MQNKLKLVECFPKNVSQICNSAISEQIDCNRLICRITLKMRGLQGLMQKKNIDRSAFWVVLFWLKGHIHELNQILNCVCAFFVMFRYWFGSLTRFNGFFFFCFDGNRERKREKISINRTKVRKISTNIVQFTVLHFCQRMVCVEIYSDGFYLSDIWKFTVRNIIDWC